MRTSERASPLRGSLGFQGGRIGIDFLMPQKTQSRWLRRRRLGPDLGLFEFRGRAIAERRMEALGMVEVLNELLDRGVEFG